MFCIKYDKGHQSLKTCSSTSKVPTLKFFKKLRKDSLYLTGFSSLKQNLISISSKDKYGTDNCVKVNDLDLKMMSPTH